MRNDRIKLRPDRNQDRKGLTWCWTCRRREFRDKPRPKYFCNWLQADWWSGSSRLRWPKAATLPSQHRRRNRKNVFWSTRPLTTRPTATRRRQTSLGQAWKCLATLLEKSKKYFGTKYVLKTVKSRTFSGRHNHQQDQSLGIDWGQCRDEQSLTHSLSPLILSLSMTHSHPLRHKHTRSLTLIYKHTLSLSLSFKAAFLFNA